MWETIDSNSKRLKVPGGWIVKSWMSAYNGGCSVHQVIVKDPNHEWTLEKKNEE